MSIKVNFSAETIRVKLPQAAHYKTKDGKPIVIKEAQIRRLLAPDMSAFKRALALSANETSGISGAKFILSMNEIINMATEAYYGKDGKEIDQVSVPVLTGKLPTSSAFKLMMWVFLHTRETSLIPTSYKCPKCEGTSIFDLDPEAPIPKNIESERWLMEDYLAFATETVDRADSQEFTYKMTSPYLIDPVDSDEDGKDRPVSVQAITVRWPLVEDYIRCLRDPKRKQDLEFWAIYDCITGINDLPADVVEALKGRNGFNGLMKMKAQDRANILGRLSDFGLDIKHSYQCRHCMENIEAPFDHTNFFDYLMSKN